MRTFFLLCFGLLFLGVGARAQNRTISGTVTDEKGAPLVNASILVKGTNVGTTTGSDGSFSLAVPARSNALVVSFVGLGEKEVALTNDGRYNITLSATVKNNLDEVVVVGYGTQRRANMTSAVGTVKAPDIENRPYTSVDQALQGKVAGLQAPMSSGQPGTFQEIRIRGIGSATAGADPLFVVDGIIINSGDVTGLTTTANLLAGLNPNDIESVSVLKDAQATSIYGSRGANGVILITTKKGRPGKTKFRADVEVGGNKLADMPTNARFLTSNEWFTLLREGVVNSVLDQGGTQAEATAAANEYAEAYGEGTGLNTNWRDIITRTGQQQQYNLSASGGDTKNTFYVSGGYFNQQATVLASDFKRFSFRSNYKHTASERLNFTVNLAGSNAIQHTPSNGGLYANPVASLPFLLPTKNPYTTDGELNISTDPDDPTAFNSGNYNPLYIAKYNQSNTNTTQIQGSVGVDFAILRNLRFSTRFGIDYNLVEELNYYNQFHGDGVSFGGLSLNNNTRYFNWINTNQFDYNTTLGASGIRLDAKLGYEAQKNRGLIQYGGGQGFPPTNQLVFSVNAATPYAVSTTGDDYSFASVYSSVSGSYRDRYILSGSFRRDGSSRFSTSNLYGNFWSVGAAWNLNREAFLQNVSYLSGLKLRGSYGTSGNADIGNYAWRPAIGFGTNYSGQPGGTFNVAGNVNLTWETTSQTDIGVDASFFKDRLTLTADVYRRVSGQLLFDNPLSATTGFRSFINNIGKMENKGFEIALSGTPIRTKNFAWNLSFNLSHNVNRIRKLPEGKDIPDPDNTQFYLREGQDYRAYYVREWAGVDPQNGDPLWYVDKSHGEKTNVYSEAQRQFIGTASPKYFGGLTSNFNFKGIDLQADFVYNYGNLVYDSWIYYVMDGAYPNANKYALQLQRWQKPGDITNVPRYVYGTDNSSSELSSRFLYKGDFIRLRNLTLGYNVPENVTQRLGISSVRIYLRGTNLWTKTYDKNLTIDPEQGVNSYSDLNVFYTKSLTAGLNVSF